ncbi:MAG: SDR family oxidoreductase [bacterium]|nr:SDR family oxidoreductase [bacterium]MCP5071129.1 SDR family oxidoreductase [bacterium]
MGLLEGKKAVVLGASSGIGWRIAERFAEEGADLIVAARREDRLEKLVEQTGGLAIRCDVSDDNQVRALADAALERWGGIDIAVNSAGLNGPGYIRDLEPEYLQQIASVLFFGFYYFMRHMGNAMAETGGGSLINVTSATAIMVPEGNAAYSGCKAGINFVTKMAAAEYGADQVRVNAMAPSFVPTAMNAFGGMTPSDETHVTYDEELPIVKGFLDETPLARIITVDECADVAVFLGSDLSSSITGHLIPVDGGNNLRRLPSWGPPRRRKEPSAPSGTD